MGRFGGRTRGNNEDDASSGGDADDRDFGFSRREPRGFSVSPHSSGRPRERGKDDIEHRILRARFGESRIHFAINCASAGCPVLPPAAFEGEDLDARLNRATRQFLQNGQNLRIDHQRRTIYLSKIFKMYADDFARPEAAGENKNQAVITFVARYLGLDPKPLMGYRVKHLPYDWSLNDRPQ